MKKRILVLGAGFGGLELSTMLSEAFGDGIEVTLIDKSDSGSRATPGHISTFDN